MWSLNRSQSTHRESVASAGLGRGLGISLDTGLCVQMCASGMRIRSDVFLFPMVLVLLQPSEVEGRFRTRHRAGLKQM